MINLLPLIEKGRIKKEYKLRLLVVNAIFFSLAFAIGLTLLLPAYFFADTIQKSAENEVLALKNSNESSEREEINNQLKITKERLVAITEQKQRVDLYSVIDIISTYTNGAIEIDTISYTRGNGDDDSTLRLNGLADTREDLLSFKESLESHEFFNEVSLPVSSLAKDKDIEFNIEINGIF